jgi:hypothetical protein
MKRWPVSCPIPQMHEKVHWSDMYLREVRAPGPSYRGTDNRRQSMRRTIRERACAFLADNFLSNVLSHKTPGPMSLTCGPEQFWAARQCVVALRE